MVHASYEELQQSASVEINHKEEVKTRQGVHIFL